MSQGKVFDKDRPVICPRCNRVFNGNYLPTQTCPSCGAPFGDGAYVNWINKNECYELACTIAKSRVQEEE